MRKRTKHTRGLTAVYVLMLAAIAACMAILVRQIDAHPDFTAFSAPSAMMPMAQPTRP